MSDPSPAPADPAAPAQAGSRLPSSGSAVRRAAGRAARACLPTLPPAGAASRWVGALLALGVLAAWAGFFVASVAAQSAAAKIVLALLNGTTAGLLVILGHDAAHGALTPWRPVNALLARLLFLAPWQTASGWQQAHREHHAFTNLKTHDDGYPPPSPAEWRQWGALRRGLWRFKHTLPGLFLFYLDVWWRRVLWPRRPDPRRALLFRADSLLVMAFVAAQVAVVLVHGAWKTGPGIVAGGLAWSAATELMLVVVLPFVVCNWWVSAITLQQHRHPELRWFDDLPAWQQGHDQVSGTVHLAWRQPAPWLLLNIFEHTAHHVDPQRPFTLLGAAQRNLAANLPGRVIVVEDPQPWRLRYLRFVLDRCQLHDYASGRWLRFDEV